MSLRFLIVEDHPIMRMGVRQLLQGHWPEAAIDEADSLAAAVHCGQQAAPRLVLLDLNLPDAAGVEGVVKLRRLLPEVPILVLSLHAEASYAVRVLQLGAAGYLTKERAVDELLQAVERILTGGRYITASLAERLADGLSGKAGQLPHEGLSAQEYRVLVMLAAGSRVSDIGEAMHLSVKTVSTYRSRILEKMQMSSNADLARYCLTHGLLDDTPAV